MVLYWKAVYCITVVLAYPITVTVLTGTVPDSTSYSTVTFFGEFSRPFIRSIGTMQHSTVPVVVNVANSCVFVHIHICI